MFAGHVAGAIFLGAASLFVTNHQDADDSNDSGHHLLHSADVLRQRSTELEKSSSGK